MEGGSMKCIGWTLTATNIELGHHQLLCSANDTFCYGCCGPISEASFSFTRMNIQGHIIPRYCTLHKEQLRVAQGPSKSR
jgi:hypothetical protein